MVAVPERAVWAAAAACLAVAALWGFAHPDLMHDVEKPQQLWRLLTAHLVHVDAAHLIGNLLGLGLMCALLPGLQRGVGRALLLAAVLIDVHLWLFQVPLYAGFSGVLYALPGLAARHGWRAQQRAAALWLMALVLGHQFLSPLLVQHAPEWPPLPAAHVWGFIAGWLAAPWRESFAQTPHVHQIG